MISDKYFYEQQQRFSEADRWFRILLTALEAQVGTYNKLLGTLAQSSPSLATQYQTAIKITEAGSVEISNGTVSLEMRANRPIGWILVTATKRFAFEKKKERGAINARYAGPGERKGDPDKYMMEGIGFLGAALTIRHVAATLSEILYTSELTAADCEITERPLGNN